MSLQVHMFLMIARYIECFFLLCLAGFLFEFSFVNDIKNGLRQFDEIAINQKSNLPDIKELLGKLINFDVNLRQLSSWNFTNSNWWSIIQLWNIRVRFRLPRNIVKVYSITLVALFIGCTSAICLSLLMVQVELAQVFNVFLALICFASEISF